MNKLRISKALALEKNDLNRQNGTVVVKHRKSSKRWIVIMDE